jgi:hypothetical protein
MMFIANRQLNPDVPAMLGQKHTKVKAYWPSQTHTSRFFIEYLLIL